MSRLGRSQAEKSAQAFVGTFGWLQGRKALSFLEWCVVVRRTSPAWMGQAENPSKPRGTFFESKANSLVFVSGTHRSESSSSLFAPSGFTVPKLIGLRGQSGSKGRAIQMKAVQNILGTDKNALFFGLFFRAGVFSRDCEKCWEAVECLRNKQRVPSL